MDLYEVVLRLILKLNGRFITQADEKLVKFETNLIYLFIWKSNIDI